MKLYLETIVESIQLENLPQEWINFDFVKFSNKKTLFDYQQRALKNSLKTLYKYYIDFKGDKKQFFTLYQNNGFTENLDYKVNDNTKKIFEKFDKDYKIENGKIKFYHFINRMSFWMATGSGKTLVIVKLLELIGNLIKNKEIPNNDILFLSHREDLIEQFKNHVYEFNSANNSFSIKLHNLKKYENVKKYLKFQNEINVFYYRSDLISSEQKDQIIDFNNYDNDGKWYILLDEAHKGKKESEGEKESKRQLYYSILSRNGFMFNFSATFTDSIDFATCVFNFNLEKFITEGYGKHIYIFRSNIDALNEKEELTKQQKQLIILKILLLYTLIAKSKPPKYYHKPLILTLVNSVNTEDSDLEMFFKEIEQFAREGINENTLNKAKEEIKRDLEYSCEFDNEKIELKDLDSIHENDILLYVFNAKNKGNIEVLKIPNNKQELVFKLTTSEKPFGLIKIGDISDWLKSKLSNYQITERFENESVFKNLNQDDSDITLLMGSRAFYEGWDSNRPNIILYINIGKGTDAKKFVLQSIGRGVRIEPISNKRRRLQFLYNNKEIDEGEFNILKDIIKPLETLFIYGTKAENLKEVIETLKQEKQEELIGDCFEINPDVKDKLLLIPTYKESDKNDTIKFEINPYDLQHTKEYFNYIGEKVALVKYDCQPKILSKVKLSFSETENYYLQKTDISKLDKPDLLLNNIIKYFSLKTKEFDNFKLLDKEIIHFQKIRISKDKLNGWKEKIEKVKRYKEKNKIEKDLKKELLDKFSNNEINIDKYTTEIEKLLEKIKKDFPKEIIESPLKIKYIQNHYYIPIMLSTDERIDYIKHIIKVKSEVNFIEELENYLNKEDNFFKKFDWWFFSKIDETLDEVFIPYYQPKTNSIVKFKPDFIFWLKKGNDYIILFIDPKGTEHTDSFRKIDGYIKIFENDDKQTKKFTYEDLNIQLILKLKTQNVGKVPDEYKKYWFDDIEKLFQEF
ncbi:MAG: DEAD/DEAH box helicase family protein [Candidatus Parvarchaeota archaeon]|nr:DEAD/DEAH box helicase family protein [Candidatus Rehaiarchaeum fermentans]